MEMWGVWVAIQGLTACWFRLVQRGWAGHEKAINRDARFFCFEQCAGKFTEIDAFCRSGVRNLERGKIAYTRI